MNQTQMSRPGKQGKAEKPGTGNTASAEVGRLIEKALADHLKGRIEQAEQLYLQILESYPDHPDALHLIGVIALQKGDNEAAQSFITKAIAIKPDFAEAHNNLGSMLFDLGRPDEAVAHLRKALTLSPDFAEAHCNLGNVLLDLGQPEQAVTSYRKSLEFRPGYAEAHNNLGKALSDLGRPEEAISSYENALGLKPDFAQAFNNLGSTLFDLGRPDEAVAHLRKALTLSPDFAEAHCNLGNVLLDLGQPEQAVTSYRKSLEFRPGYAEAHNNLGNALSDLGRPEEAISSYENALDLKPDFAQAFNNLGSTFLDLGRPDEAVAYLRNALALRPDYAEAHCNLGNVLLALGRPDHAVTSCRKALEFRPSYVEAHCSLGNALLALGQPDQAVRSYRKALRSRPDYAEAHSNLGNALMDQGRLDEAAASYRKALKCKHDYAEAHSNLIYLLKFMDGASSAEISVEAEKFGNSVRSRAEPFADWNVLRDPAKRIRVGMVSGDFRNHVVGYYLDSFLGRIDRSRVELAAYSMTFPEDDTTARLKPHFALWRRVKGLDDQKLAGLIHDDAVDILIDLSNHTGLNRLPMFAYKPAPVQATWLGLFATTGVPGMDYIVAGSDLTANDEVQYFTEEVWPLAESWFCLSPPNIDIEPGPLPAFANGTITFGCFNNLTKMTDAVVALWARVLLAISGSTLFLKTRQLHDAVVRQSTLDRFASQGIGPERLVLEGNSPRQDYFSAYHRVDVALDPFPYHGATTSLDGLWMGVPFLTMRGDRMGAHLGESIAQAAGLTDWIANDDDDYIAKAITMTAALDRLAMLRAGLRERVLNTSLFDGARFARQFEGALQGMWLRACNQTR